MRNIILKCLILITYFYALQCSCALAQTQPTKYSNTAIQLYNQGVALQSQGKYEQAEQKYSQALKLQPNFSEAKSNLVSVHNNLAVAYQTSALKYYHEKDYEKAILCDKKALLFMPNTVEILHVIARSYADMKDYKNAYEYYKKILSIKPSDATALQNFQVVKYYYTDENILNSQLNNIEVVHNSPDLLYALIKPTASVSDENIEDMKNILDIIWSEPNGQLLLQALIDNKIPINLVQENIIPCIKKVYLDGIQSKKCTIEVIIPVKTINGFNDKNLTTYMRVYNLRTFIHEFSHVFISLKKTDNGVGSLEEELGADMIGYNVSLKLITGHYMDKGQTQLYSLDSLKNLLSNEHKDLPLYSGFNQEMQKYGVVMPYPEVYSNIALLYKKLLQEKQVSQVKSLDEYLK